MKNSVMLTITSLLLLLFLTFHLAGDIVYGWEPGGLANLIMVVPFSVVWLYGTLVLAERRSGYIIMLIGGLFGLGMPVIHMVLARTVVANELARTRGDYFFVWTLLALGVTGLFSLVLSARGLWSRQWGQPR